MTHGAPAHPNKWVSGQLSERCFRSCVTLLVPPCPTCRNSSPIYSLTIGTRLPYGQNSTTQWDSRYILSTNPLNDYCKAVSSHLTKPLPFTRQRPIRAYQINAPLLFRFLEAFCVLGLLIVICRIGAIILHQSGTISAAFSNLLTKFRLAKPPLFGNFTHLTSL